MSSRSNLVVRCARCIRRSSSRTQARAKRSAAGTAGPRGVSEGHRVCRQAAGAFRVGACAGGRDRGLWRSRAARGSGRVVWRRSSRVEHRPGAHAYSLVAVGKAGGAPAYWPWVQSLRSYLRDADADALVKRLGPEAIEIAPMLPELHQLLPKPSDPAPVESEGARFRLVPCHGRIAPPRVGGPLDRAPP